MKFRTIYNSSFSRLLIVYFAGLLISIAIIRFVEFKQTRDAGTRINTVGKITSQKLKLLAAIGKTNDSVQGLTLKYFNNSQQHNLNSNARLIRQAIASNEGNLSSYRNLIRSSREQVIFNELDRLTKEINIIRGSLIFLHSSQSHEKQENVQYFISRQKYVFDRFHSAGQQLSELIGEQSENEIND